MGIPTLADAITGGDRFSIEAAASEMARRAYDKGYVEAVQDYQHNLRYALDTGPRTTPIAWFRFLDDAKVAKAVLDTSWDDLRIVDLQKKED